MKVVLQRVKSAYVKVDSDVISEIDNGYLLLWGIEESDSKVESEILINKSKITILKKRQKLEDII